MARVKVRVRIRVRLRVIAEGGKEEISLPRPVQHVWHRVKYDKGAATTALPLEFGDNLALKKKGEFTVASGEAIPNFGKGDQTYAAQEVNLRMQAVLDSQTHFAFHTLPLRHFLHRHQDCGSPGNGAPW